MGKLIVAIPESAPAAAGKLFGIEEGSLHSLKLAQNHTYSAMRDGVKIVLRITPEEHHNLASVTAQVNFVNHLHKNSVSVCEPLLSSAGNFVETLVAESGQNLFVTAWRYARGTQLGFDFYWAEDESIIRGYAIALASIHQASRTYTGDATAIAPWDEIQDGVLKTLFETVPQSATALREDAKICLDWARSLPTDREVFGLIHGDLNISNYFVDKPFLTDKAIEHPVAVLDIFDWDQMQHGWFTYDVSVVVYMMHFLKDVATELGCKENPTFDVDAFCKILYDEYCTRMGIPEDQREAFSHQVNKFVRLRKVFTATISHRILSQPPEELPEWFKPFCETIIRWYNGKGQDVCANAFADQ